VVAEIPDDAVWEVADDIKRLAAAVVETAIADFVLKPKACEGSASNKAKQQKTAKETAMSFLFSDADDWRDARNFWFALIGMPEPSIKDVALAIVTYDLDPRIGREVENEKRGAASRDVVRVPAAEDGRDGQEVLHSDKPGRSPAAA
jgi:hypothetical protein